MFCDGQPVEYASQDETSDDPQPTCTTQSPKTTIDYPNSEGAYPPSPSLDIAETAHLPSKHSLHFPLSSIATASQTYPPPAVHSSASSYQGMWPTPPPTSDDEFDEYTYRSSPTNVSFGLHATAALSPPSLVHSPRSWSPAGAHQYPYQEAVWRTPEFAPSYGVQMGTQLPTEEGYNQQILASSFADNSYLARTMEPEPMTPSVPSMTPDPGDSAMSDRSLSPMPDDELSNSYSYNDEGAPPPTGGQDEEVDLDADEANRADEPYAQLIFRAFMSRDNHAMTLQEIYQWFRENTDKAVPEHKGWQNSIRHNLSMNAVGLLHHSHALKFSHGQFMLTIKKAFIKRDRKETSDGPVTEAGTPRRSTEWVLEDWAIQKGVQSTTRYRTKNNAGRKATSSHRSGQGHHLSARATSGRRGGITASKTRLAANRAAMRRHQQYGSVLASRIPRNDFPPQQTFYNRAASMDFGQTGGNDPATPPEVPGGELIFADNTMQGPPSMGSVTSHGYYFGPGQHQHQHAQLHSPVPHSHPAANPYRLEDVTGVYEVPSMQSAAAGPVEASHLAQLPANFGNLFTEDMGESAPGAVMRVGNMNYGWGDGSQFQQ